jgi:hypothetical protein
MSLIWEEELLSFIEVVASKAFAMLSHEIDLGWIKNEHIGELHGPG